MSRKDQRRAIAVRLPRRALKLVRQRQALSRGRRLMDTLRVMLAEALAAPTLSRGPCPMHAPEATTVRLLQLPKPLRDKLEALSKRCGIAEDILICELILATSPIAADAPGSRSAAP